MTNLLAAVMPPLSTFLPRPSIAAVLGLRAEHGCTIHVSNSSKC